MPAYDPRGVQGIGLNYATGNRGGCHVRGYTIAIEVLQNGAVMDPHVTEGKAGLDITFQNLTAALDSSGRLPLRHLRHRRRRAHGDARGAHRRGLHARRVHADRRAHLEPGAALEPRGRASRKPTIRCRTRLLNEPIKTGPSKGEVSHLDQMLPEYYELRGWDEDGVPTKAKLKELALS